MDTDDDSCSAGKTNGCPHGNVHNVHKQPVGERVSAQLHAMLTGDQDAVTQGPIATAVTISAAQPGEYKIEVSFAKDRSMLYMQGTRNCTVPQIDPESGLAMPMCCDVKTTSDFDVSADNVTWYTGTAPTVGHSPTTSAVSVSFLVHAPVKPTMVRYTANKQYPQCAVFSAEGLPALPFQMLITGETRTTGALLPSAAPSPKPNSCLAALSQRGCFGPPPSGEPTPECATCYQQDIAGFNKLGCSAEKVEMICSISQKTVPVTGLLCSGAKEAWVVAPDLRAGGRGGRPRIRFPLVSFAHGYTSYNSTAWMPQLIYSIAAAGYAVIASEAAGMDYCMQESIDQIRMLQWGTDNLDVVDKTAGTGLVGHSMGGGATVGSASNASAIATHGVKAAVAMHPATPLCGAPICHPKVPIVFLTGDADTTVLPDTVKAQYNFTSGVEKVFVENKGNTHIDATGWSYHGLGCGKCPVGSGAGEATCCSGPNNEDVYAVDWLDCKIKGLAEACARVTGCKEPGNTAVQCDHAAA